MEQPEFTLGSLIRISREKKGISRAKLAEFSGISANTLAKYEKAQGDGGKVPSLGRMVTLCRVLEIDPRVVFDYMVKRGNFDRLIAGEEVEDDEGKFHFVHHFANEADYLKWELSVKNIYDLNEQLREFEGQFHFLSLDVAEIKKTLKQNGPDREDPDRSETTSNNQEAVGPASTSRAKKGSD